MKIRHIATRFALLLGIATVVPLVAYGAVSILSLQRGTPNRSSTATRTLPSAPPRKSAATSSPTPSC
jgi:hypothetical protein